MSRWDVLRWGTLVGASPDVPLHGAFIGLLFVCSYGTTSSTNKGSTEYASAPFFFRRERSRT